MFFPLNTFRKYDRNIFDGHGVFTNIKALEPLEMLYYFKGNNVVGRIEGTLEVNVYKPFQRGNWLPIQVFHKGLDYAGWVDINKIEFV